ncbi:hypothetical protein CW702_01240, partial [Candidatus Bathyarchaeota archaeon]
MRVFGVAKGFLSYDEMQMIHEGVCRVLSEVGMKIESEEFLKVLKKYGYNVNLAKKVVYFPESYIEELTGHHRVDDDLPELRFNAGGYPHLYLDPETDEVKPHTFDSSLRMAHVA